MIGKEASEILTDLEEIIWQHEVYDGRKPEYTKEGFRAAIKIFMSAVMDKTFDLQEHENMGLEDKVNMVTKLGEDLRKLIKTYTNIDTHELYKQPNRLESLE